jgi:hypothetical protein
VLGFRHEHTRPEAGTCFEDTKWRPLTPYDNKSIMHYPQCNGGTNALAWSAQDKVGATALYGAPGGGTTTPPPPSGTTKTDTKTGSVAQGASANVGTYAAVGGTTLSVKLTATQFNCRPYLDGPNEECTLTVPAGGATAYVMVYGYAAATYSITTSWIAP